MLICHCQGINDRRIREEVGRGARTVAQVGRACRAATCCGGCARAVAEIVEEAAVVTTMALPTVSARDLPAEIPLAAE